MRRLHSLFLAGIAIAAVSFGFAFSAQACSPGQQAEVLWNGSWYPAVVRTARSGGTSCYIHYNNYGNNWDEWVGPDRIRILSGSSVVVGEAPAGFREGDVVQVLWRHQWWPAHALRTKGNKLYIHYDGYGSNWDEWVGPARYRIP